MSRRQTPKEGLVIDLESLRAEIAIAVVRGAEINDAYLDLLSLAEELDACRDISMDGFLNEQKAKAD